MKKTFVLLFALIASATTLFAQSAQFQSTMQKYLAQLDTAKTPSTLQDLANKFERVASAETNQWLPYYYGAFCYYNLTFMEKDKSKMDAITDQGDALLAKAEKLAPNEYQSEIYVLKGMAAGARIMVDPMTRARQYGPLGSSYYEKAIGLNKENPRAYFLKAEGIAYTPAQFGGGADKAAPVVALAVEKYKNDVAPTSIFPHWGKAEADQLAAWVAKQQQDAAKTQSDK